MLSFWIAEQVIAQESFTPELQSVVGEKDSRRKN